MIYLELFLIFLEVGAFSFGGGYGMISLIRERMLERGWLSEGELLDMIAVAESTPGPIAVNMATFVGSSQGGAFGALLATLGVVLPSFVVILVIAVLVKNLIRYRGVRAFLSGVRPTVLGLILATAATMLLSMVFNFTRVGGNFDFDTRSAIIFLVVCILPPIFKRVCGKRLSPILLILISAGLGMLAFGVFG